MTVDEVMRIRKENGGQPNGELKRWLDATENALAKVENLEFILGHIKRKLEHDKAILDGTWKATPDDEYAQTRVENRREARMLEGDLDQAEDFVRLIEYKQHMM